MLVRAGVCEGKGRIIAAFYSIKVTKENRASKIELQFI